MVAFIRSDLDFILEQIKIAERQAAGEDLRDILPNVQVPFGLRTVSGVFNNLVFDQSQFGSADNLFPRLLDPHFLTGYDASGSVIDPAPRIISNLLVDQTADNPAAYAAAYDFGLDGQPGGGDDTLRDGVSIVTSPGLDGVFGTSDDVDVFQFNNVTPDEGLSAPFNSWMTFFGQFFDHGLDLVTKSSTEIVFIPLQPDDPLYVDGGTRNFMILSRAVAPINPETGQPEATNTTSPFVDQNQTYSSHPSHQVFLREYAMVDGKPVATGRLITNRDLGTDGEFGTSDDVDKGGMATWAVVKAQAHDVLGINLTDLDVLNVPLLATDEYGNFIRGEHGFPMVVMADASLVEGDPTANGGLGISLANAVRIGHAFLDDIAHSAKPVSSTGAPLVADADDIVNVGGVAPGQYDDELLDSHYIAGDGRVNENIGLTAVHAIFHAEHNRLVQHTKDVTLADAASMLAGGATPEAAVAFLNEWLLVPVDHVPVGAEINSLVWNGERLFQAAKFGTEMQYQHLVFEEFARTIQPNIDEFLAPNGYDTTINPAIFAEFAHTVYRFGHSMLTETVDRFDANFNPITADPLHPTSTDQMGLIAAFLNPLAFAASGLTTEQAVGAIVRGVTRQVGNEIDEFVTEALRNNLVGLPLDLAVLNLARGRDTGIPSFNEARRGFFEMTGDSQLKPYISWVDLLDHLKHPESLINFIAAFGTHDELQKADVDTLLEKRAVATALVLGGTAVINAGTAEERMFFANDDDRLAFLRSEGAYASEASGRTTTGVDDIDFWIGGLAEEIMPFGGMLGSTFNFVFETQLENLQNGDRFYYLSRTAGLHFGTQLEQNTFADLVMRNTDAAHLPAAVFSTPTWHLEVDQANQFNAGLGSADPTGGILLTDLVIRDNPETAGTDTNYLQYTGEDHVVMGGTSGADIIIAGDGDDTVYGDSGNDRIEGGYGNDVLFGGAGDDIIEDAGGDNTIHGGAGNDVIVVGKMMAGGVGQLILAGDGKDFVITTEDISTTFGGKGDDFILGAKTNLPPTGNEGNDWIEFGTQDGAPGDNFSPLLNDDVIGHDIFIGGGGFDEMIGEGGDDIFVGSDAQDKMDGMSGFDWVTYKNDKQGVTVDLRLPILAQPHGNATGDNVGVAGAVAASSGALLDRFAEVEGLSGSKFGDILYGDDLDAITLAAHGGVPGINVDIIANLAAVIGADPAEFVGNIILGGAGSDLIQGNGGDDLIDGDKWLNVRISVRENVDGTGDELFTVDSMVDLIPLMISGQINPGQLVAVREILDSDDQFDTAVFRGNMDEYQIVDAGGGKWIVSDSVGGRDGTDTLTNVERFQFADTTFVVPGAEALNSEPTGTLTITDENGGAVSVGDWLTASPAGLTDADNVSSGGAVVGPISYVWQADFGAGFVDIALGDGEGVSTANGARLRVTADLEGLQIRARAVYQDENGVLETAFSDPTAAVAPGTITNPPVAANDTATEGGVGIRLARSDLDFILDQIRIAEAHAGGEDLFSLIPNQRMALGLRTVDGSYNNLSHPEFGAADNPFPRVTDAHFQSAEAGTTYDSSGFVMDSQPRTISNLLVDQTANNPAAYAAAYDFGLDGAPGGGDDTLREGVTIVKSPGLDGDFGTADDVDVFQFDNVAPDAGLSAPFNSWMTFFGQFFDHGLDLVTKGHNSIVLIPLLPDDPLYSTEPGANNFMVVTRATQVAGPGADGILGTSDDTTHEAMNTTSPFVDQNQTYSSHPSHQVFLREYVVVDGKPTATGRLITNRDLVDDNGDPIAFADAPEIGGMATWAVVKAQAREILGIELSDADVGNVPLLLTDPYGNLILSPSGKVQVAVDIGGPLPGYVEMDPAAPAPLPANTIFTGHAFLNDIAHAADPTNKLADDDSAVGLSQTDGLHYDNELLDAHYIAGDGRVNENIGLTAVHAIFHSEHNRLADQVKQTALDSGSVAFLNEWLLPGHQLPTDGPFPTPDQFDSLVWNGERLFQAAKFGTEMQYQHLVFEEFARTIQPNVDLFFAPTQVYDVDLDASIVAEFAHTVYRFGHSMLTETVDRFDANFNPIGFGDDPQIGLIAAFLNPLAYVASGDTPEEATGAIVRGVTRQVGNEIDEFVTEALRNNLVGLPLDLAAINIARGRDTGVATLNEVRRQIYNQTGDSDLKPYRSWADLVQHLKHPESLVNFIAAYGSHTLITSETTLEGKRAAALAIVLGTSQHFEGDPLNDGDDRTIFAPSDALDFLNSTGAWANDPDGVTNTGLDDIDLWIGGLAEEKTPFGGMLGSTFNFIFENQLEKLQDGDRFYYLERTAGLAFNAELESNSFAKLIMANSNATHLPALVFSTPAFTLEVDQSQQFNGLLGSADPTGDDPLLPLVDRDNPDTVGPDSNYLHYRGDDHVVLGGTSGDDIMIASIGDDTLWGDAGNDRLDGGYGNDNIRGGAGDDIITDLGGDDNIQGGDGNDVIHGGNGINLLIGGFGQDFIITGEDANESIGGQGNDFILGTKADEQNMGNEGDDWIEGGTSDGAPGDNFDPLALDRIVGNDIFIGSGENDKFNAEGGDDIMVGSVGYGDRYIGGSGFDWASFKNDTLGVHLDVSDRFFDQPRVPGSGATVLARFDFVEGYSGSAHSDIMRGDNEDATTIPTAGAQGSTLNNIALINGLQQLLDLAYGSHQTSFADGNILLGGAGSDIIEGRGGSDLIDGDAWLNVRVSVRANHDGTGAEIASFNSLKDLAPFMLNGTYNPGQLVAVREILHSAMADFDTAQFSGALDEYSFQVNGADVTIAELTTPGFVAPDAVVTVIDSVAGRDGTDRLLNVERLQFADQKVTLNGVNSDPEGALAFSGDPVEGAPITVSLGTLTDADNPGGVITGPIAYVWQADLGVGFEDIITLAAGEVGRASGPIFTPTADLVGATLRVRALYKDANGVLEEVYSDATAPVGNVNFAPVGTVNIVGTVAEDQFLNAIRAFTDADGLTTAVFAYQWQMSPDGTNDWVDIPSGILPTFMPDDEQVGQFLRVVVTYTDDQGTAETVTSAATLTAVTNVNDTPIPPTDAAFFDVPPSEGSPVTVVVSFVDNDGLPATLNYQWEESLDGLTWNPILGALNDPSFTPDVSLVGHQLRVRITYTDLHGTAEEVFSEVSAAVLDANEAPIGTVDITDLSPTETLALSAAINFTDADGLAGVTFNYQWEAFDGADWVPIAGATDASFTPTQAEVNRELRVVVSYVDNGGHSNSVTSAPTIVTGDFINGGAAGEALTGTEGQDIIFGNGGADVIDGLGEDDQLDGGAGADIVNGDAGNDILTGGAAADVVNGGTGNDTINYAIGDGADTTDGGADTDTMNIVGAAANDALNVVFDGTSITEVNGGSVANVETVNVDLGGGTNTLNYDPAGGALTTANVVVNLAAGTASGFASVANIQNVTGGSGDDQFTGNNAANTMSGGAGTDTFFATAGGDGNDNYAGGAGTDTYNLAATAAAATITAGSATSADIGTDALASIENIVGSQGGDSITLGAGTNVIDGQGGADTINAGTGADTVFGGAGNDTIQYVVGDGADAIDGGADNDTLAITGSAAANTLAVLYNGATLTGVAGGTLTSVESVTANLGGGVDTLSYAGTTAGVTVNLTTGAASGFTSITSIENVTGGSGNDVLTGNNQANTLVGGAGNDRFVATVNDGNDTYTGNGGVDTLDLSGTSANANVTTGAASSAEIGNDTLNGIENVIGSQGNDTINFGGGDNVIDGQNGSDTILSGAGADTIFGGAGNDTINAGSGNDRISGGQGNDQMTGGSGVDTFVFETLFGNDQIVGFVANGGGQDRLLLDSSLGINAGNFGAHVTIAAAGGNTLITIDGNTITLLGVAAANVTIADFDFGP